MSEIKTNPVNPPLQNIFVENPQIPKIIQEKYGSQGAKQYQKLLSFINDFNNKHPQAKIEIEVEKDTAEIVLKGAGCSLLTPEQIKKIFNPKPDSICQYYITQDKESKKILILLDYIFSTPQQRREIENFVNQLNNQYSQFKPVKKILIGGGSSRYFIDDHEIGLGSFKLSHFDDFKETLAHEYGHSIFESSFKDSRDWQRIYLASFAITEPGDRKKILSYRYLDSTFGPPKDGIYPPTLYNDNEIGHPYDTPSELFASVFNAYYNHRDYFLTHRAQDNLTKRFDENVVSFLIKNKIFNFELKNPVQKYSDRELIDAFYRFFSQFKEKYLVKIAAQRSPDDFLPALKTINIEKLPEEDRAKFSRALFIMTTSMPFIHPKDEKPIVENFFKKLNYQGLSTEEKEKLEKRFTVDFS